MSLGTKARTAQLGQAQVEEPEIAPAKRVTYEWGELEQRCTQALLKILPQMKQIINRDRETASTALTVQQYSVLKALQERKLLISELADMLKVSRPTMSRIIDGLEGRRRSGEVGEENRRPKLVERVACQDDHRLVYARITEHGRSCLHNYKIQAEESITSVLRHLPPEDLPTLLNSLESLARVIESKD